MADGLHLTRTPWELTPRTQEARRRPQHFGYDSCWVVGAELAHEMELEVIRLRKQLQDAAHDNL